MEAADKKEFGEKGILKAEIFLFVILSKLRPQRGKHHSVDRGYRQCLGFRGTSHGSGHGPCFEGASFKRQRQKSHRCFFLERCCLGQWGKEEEEQHLRMLSSGLSSCSLSLS